MAILRVCSMNKGKEWLVIYPGTQDGGWETPTSSQSRISRKCQDMQCQFREIKSTRKGTHLCLENSGGNELLWLDFHACDICYRRSSSENCQFLIHKGTYSTEQNNTSSRTTNQAILSTLTSSGTLWAYLSNEKPMLTLRTKEFGLSASQQSNHSGMKWGHRAPWCSASKAKNALVTLPRYKLNSAVSKPSSFGTWCARIEVCCVKRRRRRTNVLLGILVSILFEPSAKKGCAHATSRQPKDDNHSESQTQCDSLLATLYVHFTSIMNHANSIEDTPCAPAFRTLYTAVCLVYFSFWRQIFGFLFQFLIYVSSSGSFDNFLFQVQSSSNNCFGRHANAKCHQPLRKIVLSIYWKPLIPAHALRKENLDQDVLSVNKGKSRHVLFICINLSSALADFLSSVMKPVRIALGVWSVLTSAYTKFPQPPNGNKASAHLSLLLGHRIAKTRRLVLISKAWSLPATSVVRVLQLCQITTYLWFRPKIANPFQLKTACS